MGFVIERGLYLPEEWTDEPRSPEGSAWHQGSIRTGLPRWEMQCQAAPPAHFQSPRTRKRCPAPFKWNLLVPMATGDSASSRVCREETGRTIDPGGH